MFENKVFRRILGYKRGDVTRNLRKLLNAELQNLYSSPYITMIKKRRLK
jgi:DNA-binding MarR family transcriptional regulator